MHLTIRRICIALMVAIGLATAVTVGIAFHLWQATEYAQGIWERFDRDRSEWNRAVGLLKAEVGYGGMIHEFKDFVLTARPEFAERAALKLGAAMTDLDKLETLASPEIKPAVLAVRKTLERYQMHLDVARRMARLGHRSTEIDQAVRIDDAEAIRGFKLLGSDQETASNARYENITSKRRALNVLLDEMGYGGLIHTIKNLILRQDLNLVPVALRRVAGALRALGAYERLGSTDAEWESISAIEEMLQNYLIEVQRISQEIRYGTSPAVINAGVHVDDEAALRAFAVLDREIIADNEREAVRVQEKLAEMYRLLELTSAAAPVLGGLFTVLLAWVLFGKVVGPIRSLERSMVRIAGGDLDVRLPPPDELGKTEIDAMFLALEDFRISERLARATQTRFLDLLSNMRDMLIILDGGWHIMFANPQAIETFEAEPDTMLGSIIWDYMPEFSSFAYKRLVSAASSQQPVNFEMFYPPLTMWLNVRTAPTLDGIALYILDITRRKNAERETQRSEGRVRSIVESVADGIVTFDGDGIIFTANPAADRLFRMGDETLVDSRIFALVPDLQTIMHRTVPGDATERVPEVVETTAYNSLGQAFPVELSVSNLAVGTRARFLCTIRDISQRKEVERMKSELISTVSHELRTPITSIRGSLGLLKGGVAGQISGKASELLAIALSNTERLLNLVNDLLDLEKLQSGHMVFEKAEVDIGELSREVIVECKSYADQYQVRFETGEIDRNVVVRGDKKRLGQVLVNLLSNAAKFSHTGGEVVVSVRRMGADVEVSVRDFGIGIAPEFQERIFERFSQVDSSDSRRKGGTGLGLNISKMIVERHDGRIGFESEPDKGTVFTVNLPAWSSAQEPTGG